MCQKLEKGFEVWLINIMIHCSKLCHEQHGHRLGLLEIPENTLLDVSAGFCAVCKEVVANGCSLRIPVTL